jgi:flagellar hook-length control protein FliK
MMLSESLENIRSVKNNERTISLNKKTEQKEDGKKDILFENILDKETSIKKKKNTEETNTSIDGYGGDMDGEVGSKSNAENLLMLTKNNFYEMRANQLNRSGQNSDAKVENSIDSTSRMKGKNTEFLEVLEFKKQVNTLRAISRELSEVRNKEQTEQKEDFKVINNVENSNSKKIEVKKIMATINLNIDNSVKINEENKTSSMGIGNEGRNNKFNQSDKLMNADRLRNNELLEGDVFSTDNRGSSVGLEFKEIQIIKTEAIKVPTIKEATDIVTKDVQQFVDMKVVGSKKITLHINQENLGKVEIQIEKRDEKIFIILRTDEKISRDRLEISLENLKNDLKEKNIDMEFEVEKEKEQDRQEKRKEQEEGMKKDDKRESNNSKNEEFDNFEEVMGV